MEVLKGFKLSLVGIIQCRHSFGNSRMMVLIVPKCVALFKSRVLDVGTVLPF